MEVTAPDKVRFIKPTGIIAEKLKDLQINYVECLDSVEFLENLQLIDLLGNTVDKHEIEGTYRIQGYLDGIEKYYLNNRDSMEEYHIAQSRNSMNFHKIARENFLHMSETQDYISYFQILQNFPVSLQPSYLLRQFKKNATYLDVFLQKNPNQFYTTN